jgi:hypothetical protein
VFALRVASASPVNGLRADRFHRRQLPLADGLVEGAGPVEFVPILD